MCSFLVTSWLLSNLTVVNYFLLPRGPDGTQTLRKGPFVFVHNLLHMTGERVWQPFVQDKVVAVYNGEIYNARQVPQGFEDRHLYRSDGECLLPAYLHLGPRFPQTLDGEFALVVVDLDSQVAVLSTDVFGTKPLWYSFYEGLHASSYRSALLRLGIPENEIRAARPNEVLQLTLSFNADAPQLGAILVTSVKHHSVHEFDLRQFKTSTQDWQAAFSKAVWKRVAASNHPIFVGLSSGYDSGALHVALEAEAAAHSVNYFTVAAEELPDLIDRRLSHNRSVSRAFLLSLSLQDFQAERSWLELTSEPFRYGKSNWAGGSVQEDGAATGLSAIFRRCRQAGILVYLSGAGADEVISDYGFAGVKYFPHSSFGGLFPEELASIFPWRSVFLGTQRDYLMKEEVVAGSHGIEARYPFLDKRVVQEFLWLTHTVKNALYKRPVHDFLSAAGYPFDKGNKDGFAAGRNLKLWGDTMVEVLYDSLLSVSRRTTQKEVEPLGHLRSGPWQLARSQLVAFLSTPENDVEAVGELAGALLAFFQTDSQSEPFVLGELCLQLLVLLLLEPSSRIERTTEGAESTFFLSLIFSMSWEAVILSGWPLFALLVRLAKDEQAHVGVPDGDSCEASANTPASLEAATAILQTVLRISDASKAGIRRAIPSIRSAQDQVVNCWTEAAGFRTVLQNNRMQNLFAALERLSEPHYRVNLADAWHLAGAADAGV
ncbi:unnamed protein product [Symbiodinium sp. CCMP2592]|nr:unnamed protein product [Symbiodinium sp. CCMP2592]